jgi:Cu/Ag efflux protein CusF
MRRILVFAILLFAAFAWTACSGQKANNAPIQKYSMDGEIMRVNSADQTATIKHKDIEGWMKAMTMDYSIRNKDDFAKLHPGDHINGTVYVQGDDFWVGDIHEAPKQPQ